MNICCEGELPYEKLDYEDVKVNVEEGELEFDTKNGVFKYKDIKKEEQNKEEMNNLDKELEDKEKEKSDYLEKIKDLDLKIKNLEKILLMDMKENQYINIIGKKTKENLNNDY